MTEEAEARSLRKSSPRQGWRDWFTPGPCGAELSLARTFFAPVFQPQASGSLFLVKAQSWRRDSGLFFLTSSRLQPWLFRTAWPQKPRFSALSHQASLKWSTVLPWDPGACLATGAAFCCLLGPSSIYMLASDQLCPTWQPCCHRLKLQQTSASAH